MLKGKGLLTTLQRQALNFFAGLPDQERFYLTGGTALAEFHLGHRLSLDLDLFTGEIGLVLPFSYQVEAAGRQQGLQVAVTRRLATLVEFVLSQGEETLRLGLALDSPFRFEPPGPSEYRVRVNSLADLRADRVLAYYGRAEPRDAVDLHFLLRQAGKEVLLDLAARKDAGFDLYWFAIALNRSATFPDEVERWPVKMLVHFDPTDLKRGFQGWAQELMSRLAG